MKYIPILWYNRRDNDWLLKGDQEQDEKSSI